MGHEYYAVYSKEAITAVCESELHANELQKRYEEVDNVKKINQEELKEVVGELYIVYALDYKLRGDIEEKKIVAILVDNPFHGGMWKDKYDGFARIVPVETSGLLKILEEGLF